MNRSSLAKFVGAGVITLGLAMAPLALPATAQNTAESDSPTVDTTPFQETKNDFNNFGWLGLIGLIGLAKLFQKRSEPVQHRDSGVASSGYTTEPTDVNRPSSSTNPDIEVRDYRDNQR